MRRKPKATPAPAGYDLGRSLSVLRAARGWKQQDLARAAGIQPSTLCAYEQGKMLPTLETLMRLLDALGFPLAALDQTRSYLAALGDSDKTVTAATPWDGPSGDGFSAEVHALSSELSRALERLHRLEGRLGAGPARESRPVAEDRSERVEALWADLNRQPYPRQQHLVVSDPAFRSRSLCERICRESARQASRKPKKALLLGQLAVLVDPAADPRLILCLRHNLAWLLATSGKAREAEALLPAVRKLSRKLNNELDLVRLHWLEARVEAGLGRTEHAIELLNGVRGEFAAREIDYDTALVTLELAALLAQENRTEEVKALARHLVPLFTAQKVHREALAALALFRQAAEREHVTAGLARDLLDFLLRARHDPSLRFDSLSDVAAMGGVR